MRGICSNYNAGLINKEQKAKFKKQHRHDLRRYG